MYATLTYKAKLEFMCSKYMDTSKNKDTPPQKVVKQNTIKK